MALGIITPQSVIERAGFAWLWRLSAFAMILHLWCFALTGYAAAYTVQEVRFRSETTSTRVVIETNGAPRYAVGRLPKPDRLYVDVSQARLAPGWRQNQLPVQDARLSAIRVAQHRRGVVRVVLDLNRIQTYTVFALQAPHRIVIDLKGEPQTSLPSRRTARPQTPRLDAADAARPTIVIDPGHGGKDPGAVGRHGIQEKTVVLEVAKALRQLIRQRLPRYRVMMTREDDVFVPLTERTNLANANQAAVFVSIHTNASRRRSARGVETWYFSFEAKSERAQRLAARENNMSSQQLSELERILLDLHETDRINQSALLAGATQKALVHTLSEHDRAIPDRGVDGAPFIVLLRTEMPSILVEIGFLTNQTEAARLRRQSYQQTLAEGIFQGLHTFLDKSVMQRD